MSHVTRLLFLHSQDPERGSSSDSDMTCIPNGPNRLDISTPFLSLIGLKQLGEVPPGPHRRTLLGAVKRALETHEYTRTGLVCAVTLACAPGCEFECELLQSLVYGALDEEVLIQRYMQKGET